MNGLLIQQPVKEYVQKIMEKANILTYSEQNTVVAFAAYYCNDPSLEMAYLTMLCVKQQSAGKGIGRLLLNASIQDLQNKGFRSYLLEVKKDNDIAIRFYSKNGFSIADEDGNSFKMKKILL